MAKESLRVRITEPCVVSPVGQETQHLGRMAEGESIELPLEDAFNVISSGRAVAAEDLPPSNLKSSKKPRTE